MDQAKLASGLFLIFLGLFRKLAIADAVAPRVDEIFQVSGEAPWTVLVEGAWLFAIQIYCDFSGYSDIARGTARLFGIELMKNFNQPYLATNITQFWRRWHISLSTWLRDYLYIPLGGSRRGPGRTYCNLFIVMLLGGLWHGAAWTFVIWGAVHGLCLAVERLIGAERLARVVPRPLGVAVTFVIVALAWVFFRADNLTHALGYISCLFGAGEVQAGAPLLHAIIYSPVAWTGMTAAALITFFGRTTWDWTLVLTPGKAVTCIVLFIGSLLVLETQSYNPFIYFIF